MFKIDISKSIQSESGVTDLLFKASINSGSIVGVFGNSGQGKSTLLNIISGISKPDTGVINFNGISWVDSEQNIFTPIQERNIGYIFQENSLFPHFTVRQNILYAVSKEEMRAFNLDSLLEQVGLSKMQDRYPSQLSGGQTQRVVIARTLAQKAKLILMDEPFTGLDLEIKQRLYKQIKALKEKFNLTIILVTHDINDIYYLCEDVFWIKNHSCNSKITSSEFKIEIEKRIEEMQK